MDENTEEVTPDPNEPAFAAGRSRRNAQRILAAADAVGVDAVRVRSVRDGYYAPLEVIEEYQRMLEAETAEAADAIVSESADGPETIIEGAAIAEGQAVTPAQVALVDGTPAPVGEDGIPVLTAAAPDSDDLPADNDDWTHGRLDDFAANHDPKIELKSGLNKTDKVAAILAALNTEE